MSNEIDEKQGKYIYEFEFYNSKNRELIHAEEFNADSFEEAYDMFRKEYSIANSWHIFAVHEYQ